MTVARAVELKHKPATVTAVALGTSNLFKQAGIDIKKYLEYVGIPGIKKEILFPSSLNEIYPNAWTDYTMWYLDESLRSVDPAKAAKWRKYLQIKKNIYLAYVSSILVLYHHRLLLSILKNDLSPDVYG